jgi:uncharacterized protein (DUF1499 family)
MRIRLLLCVFLCVLCVFVVSLVFSVNDVSTGGTPEYPDLQPRRYDLPRARVWEAALATARGMRGWEIAASDASSGEIRAVAHVFLTPFKDDVTVRVTEDAGKAIVNVRSRSRVGRSDLGVNARRIRVYLRVLDARLARE